jgi:hypothetical protein
MSQVSIIDIEGSHPQIPTEFIANLGSAIPIANQLEIFGDTELAGSIPVFTVGSGNNLTIKVQISQAIASSDVSKIGLAAFDETQFNVDANGFVTLTGGSSAINSIGVDTSSVPGTNPVVPDGSGVVTVTGAQIPSGIIGSNVIRTNSLAANTYTIEIQRTDAAATSTSSLNGVSHFNSAHFDVDADGFVSLIGGGEAIDSIALQAGTTPISPVAGLINFNGNAVAAGTNPVRTFGTGANTMELQVQLSQALAAQDATKVGLANFNSTYFTVANGFVSVAGSGIGTTITGDSGGPLSPSSGNWNILGGPGVTTSGVGSTLTINSVVFTDTTATTFSVDNGYFCTAAGTYNLPASAAQGELIIIVCDTAGAVVIDAPASNFIRLGNGITSSGGTLTSTAIGDSLTLRYRASTLTWHAVSATGNWTIS